MPAVAPFASRAVMPEVSVARTLSDPDICAGASDSRALGRMVSTCSTCGPGRFINV